MLSRTFVIVMVSILQQVSAVSVPDTSHDVIIHLTDNDIKVSTTEQLFGLQFSHVNCDLKGMKMDDFEIHHGSKVALAYSPTASPLKNTERNKMFSVGSNCELSNPVAAGDKGRHLSVKISNEK